MQFKELKLSQVREDSIVLRTVDKRSEEYKALLESVRSNGLLVPIMVRAVEDLYSIVDGVARFYAAQDLGYETIPATLHSFTDRQIFEVQLTLSYHRLPAKRADYKRSLSVMMSCNPTVTLKGLATQLSVSVEWILKTLNMKLDPKILSLVLEGEIVLPNAYVLAQLPIHEQRAFKKQAATLFVNEFAPKLQARARQLARKSL